VNLSALFIQRPATTTLLTLGIVVFGVMAYRQLPVSDLPAVDFPTIQVHDACLYITPVYYVCIERARQWLSARGRSRLDVSPVTAQSTTVPEAL
jgi:hypothetical protein